MKTVKFRGESVHSLMRQVKEEYGDNVLLLSTRQDAPELVEIEVGVLEGEESDKQVAQGEDSQPSLEVLADLFRESDIFNGLSLHGVAPDVMKALKKHTRAKQWSLDITAKALGKLITCDPFIGEHTKFVALFGAHGSGRTTTILKLAARLQSALGLEIGIIAGDYADEKGAYHLCAMGKVFGVPVVGFDLELSPTVRLQDAAERLGDCDIILIDTPEISSLGSYGRAELEEVLAADTHVEKFLLLPATKSEGELLRLVQEGATLGCTKAIASFLDKSGQVGNLVNALWRTGLPLSFISLGDEIPADIEPASPKRLAWYLSRLVH